MNAINRQMTLRRYPEGMPRPEDFDVVDGAVPDLAGVSDSRRATCLRPGRESSPADTRPPPRVCDC